MKGDFKRKFKENREKNVQKIREMSEKNINKIKEISDKNVERVRKVKDKIPGIKKIKIKKPKTSALLIAAGILCFIVVVSIFFGSTLTSGKTPTLTSFGVIHFLGYLFFILMPVEGLVPYYMSLGHSYLWIWVIALCTAVVGQLIDYGVGYFLPSRLNENLLGTKRYEKFSKIFHNHGGWIIFVFNLFPLSSSVLNFIAGMERYKFSKMLRYNLLGLGFKYLAIILLFGWLW
jgi:membrane protein YqaA with SNARE-associated domain